MESADTGDLKSPDASRMGSSPISTNKGEKIMYLEEEVSELKEQVAFLLKVVKLFAQVSVGRINPCDWCEDGTSDFNKNSPCMKCKGTMIKLEN